MDFGPSTQQFDAPPTHEALPPGTRLGGYQIIEVLGRGGFGIVYLALDSSLQRQVAIKEYLPAETAMRCDDLQVWVKPGADPGAYAAGKTAFLNEAKMLARFDHPSLARVHSFWEENRTAYMVMPYYDGRTLGAVLAEMKRPPDEAWLRALLGPLLGALSVLHHSQCLHLDISPDNIIVLRDGRPVLLDFGVASRLATDKTIALTSLLNPAYAPIEQYSESPSLPQGSWSDLYALAGVLHFAIAGRPPARATVRAVDDPQRPLAETVEALQERFPGLSYSASFLNAIDRSLAVRPRDRTRDVAEFQALLDRPVGGEPPMSYGHAASYGQPAAAAPAAFAASEPPTVAPLPGGRSEPLFQPPPPRDTWMAHERPEAPLKPARSHTSWWVAGVCALALAGVGGWAWLQRQPALAQISVTDLPPAVVASVPPPPGRASAAAASDALPAAAGSAATLAQDTAASAAATVAQAASAAPAADAASASVAEVAGVSTPNVVAAAPEAKRPEPRAPEVPAPEKPAAAKKAGPEKAAAEKTTPEKTTPEKKAPAKKAPQPAPAVAAVAEPNNPRAVCGGRSNFALVYCMQTQCKLPRFTTHPQCLDMRLRGDL